MIAILPRPPLKMTAHVTLSSMDKMAMDEMIMNRIKSGYEFRGNMKITGSAHTGITYVQTMTKKG
jgi:hypothetical protein